MPLGQVESIPNVAPIPVPPSDSVPARPAVTRIRPSRGWVSLKLADLWRYRELLYFLTWRDVKVRYKQTALGVAWAVLQPLLTMVVFTIFLGRLARVPSDNVPYSLFCFAGLVPWTFFANGLTQGSNSLVGNASLLTKVYFPRLIIPVASVLAGVVDMVLSFVLLAVMMAYYMTQHAGIALTANVLWLPLFLILAFVTALGVGLWLSALNVLYRDVRYVVPFLSQIWLFATPIAYPSSLLSEPWRTLFGLNPMTGVVEGVRWSLLGTDTAPGPMVAVSALVAVVLLVSGAFAFRRMERTFADLV
jgi:lipopolysaccharide transport system permease protein